MTKIIAVLFYLVFFVGVKSEEECRALPAEQKFVCECVSDEEFEFFAETQDGPISVEIRNCASVLVPDFVGPLVDKVTQTFVFEKIGKTLKYDLEMQIIYMKLFKILNVNNVERLNPNTFSNVERLDNFHVENTKMKSFGKILKTTDVKKFTLKNVTIESLDAIHLESNDGEDLHIIDCRIKVENGNFTFEKFKRIFINETIFESSAPGNIKINGDEVNLNRITFVNTSVNVTANEKIDMRGCCVLGKESHVYLESPNITSHANKGPNEIEYVSDQSIKSTTNTVCADDDCRCHLNDEESQEPNRGGSIQRSLFILSILVPYSILGGI